jgi:integrase
MSLTELAIRRLAHVDRPYKRFDERGLFLLVTAAPNTAKLWRLKNRAGGKETLFTLGHYPDVGLGEARRRRDEKLALIARGVDPRDVERERRRQDEAAGTFEQFARRWIELSAVRRRWSAQTQRTNLNRLVAYVFPHVGHKRLKDVTPGHLADALHRIERAGLGDTARRVRQLCVGVMHHAIGSHIEVQDPGPVLQKALGVIRTRHRPAITDPAEVGPLLLALRAYTGTMTVKCALLLAPYTFVRPGELRRMRWEELDLTGREPQWLIPGAKTKMRRDHVVPLSRQAVAILETMKVVSSRSSWVFPCRNLESPNPMSDNAINKALQALGYDTQEQMCGHGFRALARSMLSELKTVHGWPDEAIERQMAHVERNSVKRVYDRAAYLGHRRAMMQVWADYLDGLAEAARERQDTR